MNNQKHEAKRIWTFVKEPDFKLEPHGRCILNTVIRLEPISRGGLVQELSKTLETRQSITKVVSYWQSMLVRFGLVRVESPGDYEIRTGQRAPILSYL